MTAQIDERGEACSAYGRDLPIPHDFPFPVCAACGFPIPPHDLGGAEFQPRHASTCLPGRSAVEEVQR